MAIFVGALLPDLGTPGLLYLRNDDDIPELFGLDLPASLGLVIQQVKDSCEPLLRRSNLSACFYE